jgi:hypothetical protein
VAILDTPFIVALRFGPDRTTFGAESALSIPGSALQYFDLHEKKHFAVVGIPKSLSVRANIPAPDKMLTGRA